MKLTARGYTVLFALALVIGLAITPGVWVR